MFGNMGARQMKKMMQQMGIKQEEIPAEEVVIKTSDKELVISQPQVVKIKMGGQDSFQIVGTVEERKKEKFSKDDIDMVIEQTGATEEDVREALKNEGDIAKAILKLKK